MVEQSATMILKRTPITFSDFEQPGLSVRAEPGLGVGKLQLWGGDADTAFARLVGAPAPGPCRQVEIDGLTFAWMAPGEWLICGEEDAIARSLAALDDAGGDETLAVDLTHARVSLLVGGSGARNAIASHCPLDLWSEVFPVASTARSVFGQTNLFIARLDDQAGDPQFRVIVDQTMGAYAARMLTAPQQAQDI